MIGSASETARPFVLIGILLAVTSLAHHLGGGLSHEFQPEESALALGFLLLFAFLVGQIVRNFGAPMITGFLLAGILAGPHGLGMVNTAAVEPLRLVNLLALSLIAFAAGGAMKISRFRTRARSLVGMALGQVALVLPLAFLSFLLVFGLTGIMGSEPAVVVSAALLFGVFCVTNSPAEAIAVLSETRAKGPVAEAIIGVTVLVDLLVIFLFGVAGAVAHTLTGADDAGGSGFVGGFLYEQGVSFLVGGLAGMAMITYLSRFQKNVPLFLLGVAMVIVAICQKMDISPMMMAITAGLVVENASEEGERFMVGLHHSSLPVFVIFFSLSGHKVDLSVMAELWPLALLAVVLRVAAVRQGTLWGARWGGEEERVARHAWSGFVGQAGLSLGFAVMIATEFPPWGEKIATLIVATIVINEFLGPILMKRSLVAAGETRREGAADSQN